MTNILIVGVGGQGSLLASRILGHYFAARGLEVKLSEVHGMSQRGGSVVSYVRAGTRVDSPVVPDGEADFILSFELLEGLRYSGQLKKGGLLISSTEKIDPMPVITGAAGYPGDIPGEIAAAGQKGVFLPAHELAVRAGNPRTANIAVLGAASVFLGGDAGLWEDALRACVPEKFISANLAAFALGKEAAYVV